MPPVLPWGRRGEKERGNKEGEEEIKVEEEGGHEMTNAPYICRLYSAPEQESQLCSF